MEKKEFAKIIETYLAFLVKRIEPAYSYLFRYEVEKLSFICERLFEQEKEYQEIFEKI